MKVELKKLKIHKELSEETTAFTCEIWASEDRQREAEFVCYAKNAGQGGANDYRTDGERSKELLANLTTYVKRFCEEDSSDSMALDIFVDNCVYAQKFLKKGVLFIDKETFKLKEIGLKGKNDKTYTENEKKFLNETMVKFTNLGHHVINSKRFT